MSQYQDVCDHDTGKLLFRYDAIRKLIEIRARGRTHLVDLTLLDAQAKANANIELTSNVISELDINTIAERIAFLIAQGRHN